jgi:hypothetical protein
MRLKHPRCLLLAVLCAGAAANLPGAARGRAGDLPAQLSAKELWSLSNDFSEPGGVFQSDNLVSNETTFQTVIGDLVAGATPVDVYVGVGPEQNFTYIAALEPKAAFILDVRRDNLLLHLMYKAMFELSSTRGAFLARLFGRHVPPVAPDASARDLFQTLAKSGLLKRTGSVDAEFEAVRSHLTTRHGMALSSADLTAIRDRISRFHSFGLDITYSSPAAVSRYPTYAALMQETDGQMERSFLSSEARYRIVRALHERNLIIPVVGNLAGPKALRAIGTFVRDHGASVGVMYLSNVEQYLLRDRSWPAFCGNVTTLPLTARSTFIRSVMLPPIGDRPLPAFVSYVASMQQETAVCSRLLPAVPLASNRW